MRNVIDLLTDFSGFIQTDIFDDLVCTSIYNKDYLNSWKSC